MAATWWRVRYRTARQLDHFLARPRDWWNFTGCKTLRFGQGGLQGARRSVKRRREQGGDLWTFRGGGAVAWSPYTDREPVEIHLRVKASRSSQPRGDVAPPAVDRPDYESMVGPTAGAETKGELFAATLTARVLACGRPLEWREICSVVQTVALEVLGKKPKRHKIPWLQGHEAKKESRG
eukprot:4593140-Pyramimonas_sp.AAC.1